MARMLLSVSGFALMFLLGCSEANEPLHKGVPISKWIAKFNARLEDRGPNEDMRDIVKELTECGEPAVPYLIDALADDDGSIVTGAAWTLLTIGDAPAIQRHVIPLLQNEAEEVRMFAAMAMVKANKHTDLVLPVVVESLHAEAYWARNHSIKILGTMGPESTDAVKPLAKLLTTHADAEVRWRVAYTLVRIGPTAVDAVPALIEALHDPSAQVREGAAYALGAIQQATPQVTEALQLATEDPNAKVRHRAAKSLEQLLNENPASA